MEPGLPLLHWVHILARSELPLRYGIGVRGVALPFGSAPGVEPDPRDRAWGVLREPLIDAIELAGLDPYSRAWDRVDRDRSGAAQLVNMQAAIARDVAGLVRPTAPCDANTQARAIRKGRALLRALGVFPWCVLTDEDLRVRYPWWQDGSLWHNAGLAPPAHRDVNERLAASSSL